LSANDNASPAALTEVAKRRLVHAMLDGVFESRNNIFDVCRQPAMTFHVWPKA
jgi:hypothetical protein